jgi:hypothetical protein
LTKIAEILSGWVGRNKGTEPEKKQKEKMEGDLFNTTLTSFLLPPVFSFAGESGIGAIVGCNPENASFRNIFLFFEIYYFLNWEASD